MKSILLATASILAFAGAAAADVSFGGDAVIGFNLDEDDEDDDGDLDGADCNGADPEEDGYDCEDGFFWEANLGVTLSQELDNGLVAAATFTLNIAEDNDGDDSVGVDNDFLFSLTAGDAGGLFLGDTKFAAEQFWDPAGTMQADDFSEQDGENVLKGTFMYNGINGGLSYIVTDDDNVSPEGEVDQLSLGASTTVGAFNLSAAYQEESEILEDGDLDVDGDYNPESNDDFSPYEVFGVSAGTTFGGADVRLGYARNQTLEDSSLGLEVTYPFGPVSLSGYYVLENNDESDFDAGNEDLENTFGVAAVYESGPIRVRGFYEFEDDGNTTDDNDEDDEENDSDFGVEGSFDTGNGIVVRAGYIDSTEGYVGVEYDLGEDAKLIASYAEQDEEGEPEYEEGFTVAAEFQF